MSNYDTWRSTNDRAEYEAALDRAVETRAEAMWADSNDRVDLLETIGTSERNKLIAALTECDYRRFARLINDAGYEEVEADIERNHKASELDRGADLLEKRAA